jgi:lipopolysaccharide export system protein LptA
MRTSPIAVALVLAALVLAALAPAALAEKADREKEIQVLADRLSADDAKREAVYEGNVIVTQGTLRVAAARIVVREDAEGHRNFVATGAPVTFRQKRDNTDDWVEGEAQRVEFDDKTDLLKLLTRARLKSAQGDVTGDFISYDRGRDFFQVSGGAPGTAASTGSRVKATIIPPKKGAQAEKPSPPIELKPDRAPGTGG